MKESELQKYCINRLKKCPYLWGWRNNSGVAKEGKRFIRFGLPGSADFIGLLQNGRFVAIEFKMPGGKQSLHQKEFEKMILDKKGIYQIIQDFEQFDIFMQELEVLSCKV